MNLFLCSQKNQWQQNGGKCGICGDPWQGPKPHECPNGEYCSKVIVKDYQAGQEIDVTVNLTQSHLGYFKFRVCPVTDETTEVTQECLNKNTLQVLNGGSNERDKFMVT